ncbi:MAG: YqgE/AlgH family protein [Planctomycetota bacterium]
MPSLAGQFLIAAPSLRDPNFYRSVILIVQHDDEGALGLIVNRPMELTVADAVDDDVEAADGLESQLHLGGPCPGLLSVLHDDNAIGHDVIEGVRFTNDRAEIERLMRSDPARSKYIAGYAGWGPAQLEDEVSEDAWLIADAKADDVFREPPDLWQRLLTRLHLEQYIDPERIPDEPGLN